MARETIICSGRSAASPNVAAMIGKATYVQIDVATDCGSDLGWASSANGLDLRLIEPDQASELYRYAWLLGRLPVRVSIPSISGVASAVRIAIALGMAVKLDFPPRVPLAWKELDDVLDLYLHGRFVGQPVEPFHSLLQAAFSGRRENMWRVQDEDPTFFDFVSGHGEPTSPSRFDCQPTVPLDKRLVARWQTLAASPGSACCGCRFQRDCGGYFLWPERSMHCDAQSLWTCITQAAEQLTDDLQREGASPA